MVGVMIYFICTAVSSLTILQKKFSDGGLNHVLMCLSVVVASASIFFYTYSYNGFQRTLNFNIVVIAGVMSNVFYLRLISSFIRVRNKLLERACYVYLYLFAAIHGISFISLLVYGDSPLIISVSNVSQVTLQDALYRHFKFSQFGELMLGVQILGNLLVSFFVLSELLRQRKRDVLLILGVFLSIFGAFNDVFSAAGVERFAIIFPLFYAGFIFEGYRFNRSLVESLQSSVSSLRHELSEMSSLAKSGVIAGSVTHDINGHLAVIMGLTRIAGQKTMIAPNGNAEDADVIKKIQKHAEIIGDISNGYLHLYRTGVLSHKGFVSLDNLIDTVRSVAEIRAKQVNPNIKLIYDFPHGSFVYCSEAEFSLCLTNLVNNAIDACRGRDDAVVHLEVIVEKRSVKFYIRDNGCGIPDAIVEKIFDLNFSTKMHQGGTGIGLATVARVFEEHDFKICLNANAPPFTEFEIEIPMKNFKPPAD